MKSLTENLDKVKQQLATHENELTMKLEAQKKEMEAKLIELQTKGDTLRQKTEEQHEHEKEEIEKLLNKKIEEIEKQLGLEKELSQTLKQEMDKQQVAAEKKIEQALETVDLQTKKADDCTKSLQDYRLVSSNLTV